MARHLTAEHRKKLSIAHIGKNIGRKHGLWTETPAYTSLHSWVVRRLGKPKICYHCKSKTKKRYEWANIDHKYRRDVRDWIRLCTSCHRQYDYANGLSKKGPNKLKKQKTMTLKDQVLHVLLNYPETRNSDITLTLRIWLIYYPEHITKVEGKNFVRLSKIFELPREDNVKRIRAKIQNEEHRYLPTDPQIIKRRKIKEQEWRTDLGYSR